MEVALLDTNIISALFRPNDPTSRDYFRIVSRYALPAISFMTLAELLVWPKLNRWGEAREASLRNYLTDFVTLFPDEQTCEILSGLKLLSRRSGRPINEQDAWIAATALRYQIPLITRNHRDFNFIDELELIPVDEAETSS